MQTMRGGKSLESLVKRYAAYRIRFASQTIACNTFHAAQQRVCRRLLMAHDRAGRHDFLLTHEVLGQMLGVHRQAITPIARTLQKAKLMNIDGASSRFSTGRDWKTPVASAMRSPKPLMSRS